MGNTGNGQCSSTFISSLKTERGQNGILQGKLMAQLPALTVRPSGKGRFRGRSIDGKWNVCGYAVGGVGDKGRGGAGRGQIVRRGGIFLVGGLHMIHARRQRGRKKSMGGEKVAEKVKDISLWCGQRKNIILPELSLASPSHPF
jgi:hypothetical protein